MRGTPGGQKRVHTDGGGEFINSDFRFFLDSNGTKLTYTTADTPQHNGIAERMNGVLLNMVRSMLAHARSSLKMWGEAMLYAAYVYNSTPHRHIKSQTPFTRLTGKTSDITKLHVFGCDAWYHVPEEKRGKLQARFQCGIFVGISVDQNAYRIMNPETRTIVVSRDVKFDESSFRSVASLSTTVVDEAYSDGVSLQILDSDEPDRIAPITLSYNIPSSNNPFQPIAPTSTVQDNDEEMDSADLDNDISDVDDDVDEWESKYDDGDTSSASTNSTYVDQNSIPKNLRSTDGNDYPLTSGPRESKRVSIPATRYEPSLLSLYCDDCEFALSTVEIIEPQTYKQAITSEHASRWQAAMKEELTSLSNHKAWDLIPLPAGAKPIKARWVFKVKLDGDNNPIRWKARVVAKGFQQVYGVDYMETFAPVAKLKSIKLVLAITAQLDLELMQLDFDTAFLNASLTDDLYMEQPPGFHQGADNIVCKLKKALYGLKQAPYEWNKNLHKFHAHHGLFCHSQRPLRLRETHSGRSPHHPLHLRR